ncbi:MAG: GAF domain-containing protein [Phycisphaerales bacterium]
MYGDQQPFQPIDPRALEQVIITGRLRQRPYRGPNYEAENRALVALMQCLGSTPECVLNLLAEKANELCRGHSAGISIEEGRGPHAVFRFRSVAGRWRHLEGTAIPRWNTPCAVVLDRCEPILMNDLGRAFALPREMTARVWEVLLVPLRGRNDVPVGTIWVVSHEPLREFDREDLRLMESLAAFGSAAWRVGIEVDGGQK